MDIFGRFARDPACLVAIDAADGGRWRSPFRPGVVYPSAVPRNNAATVNLFYDFAMVWQMLPAGCEFDFEIDFSVTVWQATAQYVFSNQGPTPARFECATMTPSGAFQFYVCTMPNPVQVNVNSIPGRYQLKISVRSDRTYIYINGLLQGTYDNVRTFVNGGITKFYAYYGIIHRVKMTLVNRGVLYDFPSFEERTILLTKSNVAYGQSAFRGASSAERWCVTTPVVLTQQILPVYTFICRCKFVTASAGYQVAFGDGQPLSGSGATEGLHLTYWPAQNAIRVNFRTYAASMIINVTPVLQYLDKWVTYALVIDSETNTMKLFADGVLMGSVSSPNISSYLGGYTSRLKISNDIVGVAGYTNHEVDFFGVLKKSLSQAQIKLYIGR